MSNILNRPGWTNKPVNNLILEMARETSMPIIAVMLKSLKEFLLRKEAIKLRGTPRETVFELIRKKGFDWLQNPPFSKGNLRINLYKKLPPNIKKKADRDLLKFSDYISEDDRNMIIALVGEEGAGLTKPDVGTPGERPSKRKELAMLELKRQEKISRARENKLDSDVNQIMSSIGKAKIPEDLLHYVIPVMFARLSQTLDSEDIEISKIEDVINQLQDSLVKGEEAFSEAVLGIFDSNDEEESRIAVFIYKAYKNAVKEVTEGAKLGPSFRKGLRASEVPPDREPNFDIPPRPPENSEHLYTTTSGNSEDNEMCDYTEAVKISQTKQNQLLTENYRKRRQHQYRINEKYNKQ